MKKHISPIILVLAIALLLCLSGCDSIGELIEEVDSTPVASEPVDSDAITDVPETDPLLEGKTVSENGTLGTWQIGLAGADKIDLTDGKTVLVIYYDFTNNSTQSISAFHALGLNAYQNGAELNYLKPFDPYPYKDNSSLRIRPGTTLRCSAVYDYNADGGLVEVQLNDWAGDHNVIVYSDYDPAELPGETGSFELALQPSPTGTHGLPRQAVVGGCEISISSEHAIVADWNNGSCLRISISLVNSTESDVIFSDSVSYTAYQDGVELNTTAALESLPDDGNTLSAIPAGGNVTINLIYALRSASPVEFEIISDDGVRLGTEYNIS